MELGLLGIEGCLKLLHKKTPRWLIYNWMLIKLLLVTAFYYKLYSVQDVNIQLILPWEVSPGNNEQGWIQHFYLPMSKDTKKISFNS